MATRAEQDLENIRIETWTVAAGQSVTAGQGVIRSGADKFGATVGANGPTAGIALETRTAGQKFQCALLNGDGCIPVKVGTGGATAEAYAIATADGFTDKALGGGSVAQHIAGRFTQSGVVGDLVGLRPSPFVGGAA
jgi:hypothetical protein